MGKKLLYKNGDPEVYREFTDATWKHMTDVERAMWTEFTDNEPAPIPQEVLDFKKAKEVKTTETLSEAPELSEEKEKEIIKEELRKRGIKFNWNTGIEKLRQKLEENAND